jgi:hypothetical protein
VLAVLGPIRVSSLREQLGDLGLEVGVGAVGRGGGVGLDLGAVQGDQPQAHHPGGRAQLQRGDQQSGQGSFVADPEPGDGHVIGRAVAGQDAKGDVFGAAAMPIGSIGGQERTQIELVDHVEHEPGQMIGWQPLAHIRWEQKGLVTVTGTEVVGHGRSYATSLLCCLCYQSDRPPFGTGWYARQFHKSPQAGGAEESGRSLIADHGCASVGAWVRPFRPLTREHASVSRLASATR